MSLYRVFLYPLGFWFLLHFIRHFVPSHHWTNNFHLGWFTVGWHTTSLDKIFRYLGQHPVYSKFFVVWFTAGVVFGVGSMIFSVLLLVWNLIHMFAFPTEFHPLTPMLPGVNIPYSQLMYYFVSLLISGIIHEFGHAIAAVVEGLPVEGFGLFVTLAYPGAYVNIQSHYFENLSTISTLRVVCAGVWHNAILALIAFLLLQPGVGPGLAYPFYEHVEDGVIVAYVSDDVYKNIEPYTRIMELNECVIREYGSWVKCFREMQQHNFSLLSYCSSTAPILDDSSKDCCKSSYSGPLMCWEYGDTSWNLISVNNKNFSSWKENEKLNRFCLSAYQIVGEVYCPTFGERNQAAFSNSISKSPKFQHHGCYQGNTRYWS
eukprot:TRINITY_DN5124_c0_g1_i10.p1 TRINITY_DN5124_c0_g1~~TRINITY_DN5124_c0_g1_i10.p1  ORF type:complete len:374 (-),score=50.57 TRINITY_DN5124_c0_g1_i10:888-2009(-)